MHRFYGNLRQIRNFSTGRCGHRPLQRRTGGFPMYESTRQRVCKWLLLAVLVFSTLDAALFALFDIGTERLGLRCLNSFFEYLPAGTLSGEADRVCCRVCRTGRAGRLDPSALRKTRGNDRDLCRFSPSVFQKYSGLPDQHSGPVQCSGLRRAGAGLRKGSS